MPAVMAIMVKIKKKADIEYSALILSIRLPVFPARKLAIAEAVNHTPNMRPTYLAGDNLLIYDSPTGDTNSSPIV